ncbi:MAG: hypothetical protein IPM97_00480 [Bdellovibrionaceae bacterium]|nr:hypothetical protein [Pseudobdellovibrionaceae bacterium]
MKRALIFTLTLTLFWLGLPATVNAVTPEVYSSQILKKDLPHAQAWLRRLAEASSFTLVDTYSFYQSALPELQENHHQGISVRGSLERMLLLLEGARYFPQVEQAPLEFHNKKESILKVLQIAKDHLDRMQIGEDPQVLLEEWAAATTAQKLGSEFEADLLAVFSEMQRLLIPSSEQDTNSESSQVAEVQAIDTENDRIFSDQKFEEQRFSSYVQTAEGPILAEECQAPLRWKTERAEFCEGDDFLECDRNYARQCKKLQ